MTTAHGRTRTKSPMNNKYRAILIIPVMMLAAGITLILIKTGDTPQGTYDPIPYPSEPHEAELLKKPEVQRAVHRYHSDAVLEIDLNVQRENANAFNAQLERGLGPLLGWHVYQRDGYTVVAMPESHIPLLEELKRNPAEFIRRQTQAPQAAEPGETYVNVLPTGSWQKTDRGSVGVKGTGIALIALALLTTMFVKSLWSTDTRRWKTFRETGELPDGYDGEWDRR